MRKIYLLTVMLLAMVTNAFAQFTNKPEVKASFDAASKVWVKVCFLDGKYPGEMKFLTDNFGNGFKSENEMDGDNGMQLFQLVGSGLNDFKLVSKFGYTLYLGANWMGNPSIEGSKNADDAKAKLKLLPAGDKDLQGYKGIATKVIKFVNAEKYFAPTYAIEYTGYIDPHDSNDGVVVVFKVVGGTAPDSDPAPDGGGGSTATTFELTKVVNGSGDFKVYKRGTSEEITDLTKIEENTEVDIIAEPATGFVLKQISDGTTDYLNASSFDPKTGFATTFNGLPALTKNTTLTVTFVKKEVEKQKFMLLKSFGTEPAGGDFKIFNATTNTEITGTEVEEGTVVYVQAIPEEGYILKQVKVLGQGELFQESNFDPKVGFSLTVNGINPISQNTRITLTFVKKEEEATPEEEVKNAEGFTNAPSVVASFDADAKKWYKIYFVNVDQPDTFKLLTAKGVNQGIKLENAHDNDDNQLWQLVGTDRNDFQLVSKSGIYLFSKMGYYGYELDGNNTPKSEKYQLRLLKPEDGATQTYKTVPTKLLKFADRNSYDLIYPSYDNIESQGWAQLSSAGYNYKTAVVFKQIGEDPKPVEKVSITIQCEATKGDVTIDGVTDAPTIVTANEKTWVLESGKEYTLNVQAKKGWQFSHIYDNRYVNIEAKTFTASKENTRVEVHFKQKKYPITLNKKYDGGSVSVTNAFIGELPLDYEVKLSVTPDAGYELESLTVRGEDISETKSFLIDEDNTILAVFKKKTTGTVHTLITQGGSVTLDGHKDGDEVKLGEEVSLIVTPSLGYELVSLSVGGNDVKDSKKFTVTVDNTIQAVFQKKTYTLTVPTVTGGKLMLKDITAGEKVEFGTTVTVEVEAETGYELATLTAGGQDIKEAKTFVVGENNEITASFTKKTYELILPKATDEGVLELEGIKAGEKVEFGTEVTVKVLPKKGFELESLMVGDLDITATKKFVVGENNTIVVKWAEKLYTLTAPQVTGGKIIFLGLEEGQRLKIGTKVRVKVVPEKGYKLAKLTVGGKDITESRVLTVDENNEVVVKFRKASPVEMIEGVNFAVYPNPATEYVVLEGLEMNAKVIILDLTGKPVLTAEADYAGSLRLNVSHLPKGLYLVRSGRIVVKLQIR